MSLAIERTGTRQFQASNSRGATLSIGRGEGQWTPGELLKIALLGCNAMSADQRFAGLLGDDFALSGVVDAEHSADEERFTSMSVELIPDFGDATDEQIEQTIRRALGAIERQCTIGRTLDHVVPHTTVITAEK